MGRGPALGRSSPASHGGGLPSVVPVNVGQAGGSVDGQVGLLGQSHQGDVVAVAGRTVVVRSEDDHVNVEVLRDQRLVLSVELVFAQPDFQ